MPDLGANGHDYVLLGDDPDLDTVNGHTYLAFNGSIDVMWQGSGTAFLYALGGASGFTLCMAIRVASNASHQTIISEAKSSGTAEQYRLQVRSSGDDASYTRNGSDVFDTSTLGVRRSGGSNNEWCEIDFARAVVLDNPSPSAGDLDYLEEGLADHVGITI